MIIVGVRCVPSCAEQSPSRLQGRGGIVLTITIMTILLSLGLVVGVVGMLYLLMERNVSTARDLTLLSLFCSVLSMLAYMTELHADSFAAKMVALQFGYVGKAPMAAIMLCLVLRHYNRNLHRYWHLLMFLPALICQGLVYTCEFHTLFYQKVVLMDNGLIQITPGIFYYFYWAYTLILNLMALGICLFERKSQVDRAKQHNTLLLAESLPMAAMLMYLSGSGQGFDWIPLGIMLSTLIWTFSVIRFGLLDQDTLLQSMTTALLVLDNEHHLLYTNPAAVRLIPSLASSAVRQHKASLESLLSDDFSTIVTATGCYQRNITELKSRGGVRGVLMTFDDITAITEQLNRDSMTGLYNHAAFYSMLTDLLASAAPDQSITVSVADIDNFKKVNDNYGHANGDIVLISLAQLLMRNHSNARVFRYGGEEFALIFPCALEKTEAAMQELLDSFSQMHYPFMEGTITFSYGSAQFNGTETAAALFERADALLYKRKRAFHAQETAQPQSKPEGKDLSHARIELS